MLLPTKPGLNQKAETNTNELACLSMLNEIANETSFIKDRGYVDLGTKSDDYAPVAKNKVDRAYGH